MRDPIVIPFTKLCHTLFGAVHARFEDGACHKQLNSLHM